MIQIKALKQLDNYTFQIVWSDLKQSQFRLSFLQNHCPCARCRDRSRGSIVEEKEDLRALKIFSVGRYALRVEFASGCNRGVFSFSYLRELNLGDSLE